MHRALAWIAATFFGATVASTAAAQNVSKDNYPQRVTARPLTLPQWMVELHVEAMIDISRDRVFKDISLPPDVYVGLTDKFTLGLEHSKKIGTYGLPGTAPFCIGGNYCAAGKVYDQVAVDGKYSVLRDDKFELAVHGILGGQSLDPFGLATRIGVAGRWRPHEIFTLDFDPGLGIGITNRDNFRVFRGLSAGNKEFLYLPVRGTIQANDMISIFADLYFLVPFDEFSQIYRFGVNVGAGFAVTQRIDVGPELRLPSLLSGSAYDNTPQGGFNARQLGAFANFRF